MLMLNAKSTCFRAAIRHKARVRAHRLRVPSTVPISRTLIHPDLLYNSAWVEAISGPNHFVPKTAWWHGPHAAATVIMVMLAFMIFDA